MDHTFIDSKIAAQSFLNCLLFCCWAIVTPLSKKRHTVIRVSQSSSGSFYLYTKHTHRFNSKSYLRKIQTHSGVCPIQMLLLPRYMYLSFIHNTMQSMPNYMCRYNNNLTFEYPQFWLPYELHHICKHHFDSYPANHIYIHETLNSIRISVWSFIQIRLSLGSLWGNMDITTRNTNT